MIPANEAMEFKSLPPELCSIAQCDVSLDFSPLSHWPEALPAVAVNKLVYAGFRQKLALNHQMDPSDFDGIAQHFYSLYSGLSFAEVARLIQTAKAHPEFPMTEVVQKFQWQVTEQFLSIAEKLVATPLGFQNWCADKKLNPQDLAPLLSATALSLNPLMKDMLELQLSKSLGTQALELAIELMLMGSEYSKISVETLLSAEQRKMHGKAQGELWVESLKRLRYPQTFSQDQSAESKMTSLPWPGTSQARWVRHGDKAGIELKIFVSQPSDLKKHLQSLTRVQDLMEKDPSGTKH